MVAFLGEANMHEQLFGHLLAVCCISVHTSYPSCELE